MHQIAAILRWLRAEPGERHVAISFVAGKYGVHLAHAPPPKPSADAGDRGMRGESLREALSIIEHGLHKLERRRSAKTEPPTP